MVDKLKNIKEMKIKGDIKEYLEEQKKKLKEWLEAKDIKVVGIKFYFLIDNEYLNTIALFSDGFNPNDFEGGDD